MNLKLGCFKKVNSSDNLCKIPDGIQIHYQKNIGGSNFILKFKYYKYKIKNIIFNYNIII